MKEKENDELDIQLKVFDENKEDDLTELSHRLNDIRAEMEYPFDKPEKSFCMYCEKGICGWFCEPSLEFLSASPIYIHLFILEPHYDAVLEIPDEELSDSPDDLPRVHWNTHNGLQHYRYTLFNGLE